MADWDNTSYSRPISSDEITGLIPKSPFLLPDGVRPEMHGQNTGDDAPHREILDIGRCRVRLADSHHAICLVEGGNCCYMLPYGGLCGHSLVEVIAEMQPA